MKRTMIMAAFLALVMAGGSSLVLAGNKGMRCDGPPPTGKECGCRPQPDCNKADGCDRHLGRLSAELGLSETQRQEIETIIATQKQKDAPLREKILAGKQQLWKASQKDEMSETAIEDLAAEQARLMSKMMVSRVQVRKQIFGVLTPLQQEQAEKLHDGHGAGFGCGSACGGHGCNNRMN